MSYSRFSRRLIEKNANKKRKSMELHQTSEEKHRPPDEKQRPIVGIGVFVYRSHEDPRFLLGVRKGSSGAGTWSLAGGHLEHNETFEACSKREVLEETGLEIEHVGFLAAVESFFEAEDKHYVTLLMTGYVKAVDGEEIPEPKTMEPEKCEGWKWLTFCDMRKLNETDGGSKLFLPLRNFFAQRPELCECMEEDEAAATPVEGEYDKYFKAVPMEEVEGDPPPPFGDPNSRAKKAKEALMSMGDPSEVLKMTDAETEAIEKETELEMPD